MENQQKILAGLAFSALSAILLASTGLCAKLLGDILNPVELLFARSSIALLLLVAIFFMLSQTITVKTERPWAHIIRNVIGTIGMIMAMWAFTIMPLTQATILFFTVPLWVTLMSSLLLKEKIGFVRLSAVIFGFAGVYIATGPSGDFTLLQLTVGLGYAFLAACVEICLRWMGNTESASTTTLFLLAFSTLTTGLYLPLSDISISMSPWIFACIIAVFGIVNLGYLLAKTQSFRLAEASIITPITYTMIIWTAIFDYIFWNNLPSVALLIGGSIIIASNLIILKREQKRATS